MVKKKTEFVISPNLFLGFCVLMLWYLTLRLADVLYTM